MKRKLIYVIGALAGAILLAEADTVKNGFVEVVGEGARANGDRDVVLHEPEDPSEVKVSTQAGWRFTDPQDAAFQHHVGATDLIHLVNESKESEATIKITDDWEHTCEKTNWEEHVSAPKLVVGGADHALILLKPDEVGVFLETNCTASAGEDGIHNVWTKCKPCRHPDCRGRNPLKWMEEKKIHAPDQVEGEIRASGKILVDPDRTEGYYLLEGPHELSYVASFDLEECEEHLCVGGTVTNTTWDVCRLSVTNTPYLGIDLTDEGKKTNAVGIAEARYGYRPKNTAASYTWEFESPRHSVIAAQDDEKGTARLESARPAEPSDTYQGDQVFCHATLTETNPPEGHTPCTASATATNAVTVVRVDVQIGGVAEEKEETEGAFIPYVPDATNGSISVEGVDKSASVRFICEPNDLPPNERVRVSAVGPAELYQRLPAGKLVKVVSTNYFANEISRLEFVLHGHAASDSYKDGSVEIVHLASGAKDRAKYTSVRVNVEITDFPTQKLLGEDKEEIPGAFIPYAADWAFAETPSNDEDIPFGLAAQEKLVNVYVSYEPADLPEEEDPDMKFLAFEAPSASLYLMGTAGTACRWKEFTDWWNSCPPECGMTFEGKMRLLLHGHEKSKRPRDREIRVTHPRSGATDVAKYTVFHVDLDIDSDNDLAIENEDGFEDAIEEREPGKIISWDQSGISPGQDYRVPLRLSAWGGETNAVVRLEAVASSARVAEIYRTESGGNKLDLPFYFPADSIPPLYVDGVTNGTISITATLINPPEGVSATSSVRPIPGIELAEDKVSALIIQPISFSPSGGAAVWSSIPNDVLDGDGVVFDSLVSNQGYKVTWYRDEYGEGDLSVGDCWANAYLNLDAYGAVTIISHGETNEHPAVYFPYTTAGYNAASRWVADVQYSGGRVSGMTVERRMNRYWYVSVKPRWFEDNWKAGFDKRNSIVLWASCFSSTLLDSCGGRWRSGYEMVCKEPECSRVNSQFLQRMNGIFGAGTFRPAGTAYSQGRSSMLPTSVRMEGNLWTTLCPAPIIGNPTFPSSALAEGDVAFGCLLLDTFVKAKSNMIKVIAGDGVSGVTPLRQEGAKYPFGVGFRIKKGSGTIKVKSEAIKVYIESATPNDEFASGKTMDADRITPNGGIIEWEF